MPRLRRIAFALTLCILGAPLGAAALDKCGVKQAKDGTLFVSALDVIGTLRFGYQPDVALTAIPGGCVTGGVAKSCPVAAEGEEARTTLPPHCVLYLEDGEDTCTAPLKKCVPGLRSACPPDMQRLGDGCIERVVNDGLEFAPAVAACHERGRRVCTLPELLECDVLNLSNGVFGSCGNWTDTSHATWTLGSNTEDGGNILGRLVWYDGTDNSLTEQTQGSGGIYDFFCCAALGAE